MEFQPVKPALALLFRANVNLGHAIHVSRVPSGERRIIPITGGSFKGEKLCGEILPGGSDWQIVQADGLAVLHAKYAIRTDDGALIYIENRGIRFIQPEILSQLMNGEVIDPKRYYFRTTPQFETGDPRYLWLNNIIAVCSGMRLADEVVLDFYHVL